jgi:hypothetical protein
MVNIRCYSAADEDKHEECGTFRIEDGKLIYDDKGDEASIGDIFPSGKMSKRTSDSIWRYMMGHHRNMFVVHDDKSDK